MTAPEPGECALAEYRQLKTEQTARIGFRDNLIYFTIIAVAGALAAVRSAHGHGFLLLVPVVTFCLGWTYLRNDHMITAIGRYVAEHPLLPGMNWETEHPADQRRATRKIIQLAADLIMFCGSAFAALIAFWLAPGGLILLILASIAETAGTIVLASQFISYAQPLRRA